MEHLEERGYLPDSNRLSVVASTILLAYALTPFVSLPPLQLNLGLAGALFPVSINFGAVISLLAALLAGAGTDWLLRGHPGLDLQSLPQHWILPALTAWVIGVPLNSLKVGASWWAVFALGGVLLVLVLMAEYIVVDFNDVRFGPATIGVTAVSYALFLVLAISGRAAGLRLYLELPAVVAAVAVVTLRTLYLRLGGRWSIHWGVGVALAVGGLVVGLHYWPISPLSYGLFLLGPAYSLSSLAGSIEEGHPARTIWVEPGLMTLALWTLAFILGR